MCELDLTVKCRYLGKCEMQRDVMVMNISICILLVYQQ